MNRQERDELELRELFPDHVDQLPVSGQPVASSEIDSSGSPASSQDALCTPPQSDLQAPHTDLSGTPAPGTAFVPSPGRPYKSSKIQNWEVQIMLQMRAEGHKIKAIAERLNRSEVGVYETLEYWQSTADLAKAILQRDAHVLADRIVAQADVSQATEVLDRLDILPKRERESGGNKVQVVIGLDTDKIMPKVIVQEIPSHD